jgi:uncharacterized protein YmfQ (DUF2313 family)
MTRHTPLDYQQMFLRLQPPGLAWSRRLSSNWARLWLAEADGLARVESETFRLIAEANPLTTWEALTDWERVLGLPDECSKLSDTIEMRRRDVIAKLRAGGGQTKEYFQSILDTYGFEAVIEDNYDPFRADHSRAEDRVYECPAGTMINQVTGEITQDYYTGWVYVWGVRVDLLWEWWFRADTNAAGDRLRGWEAPDIACRLEKLKPAETFIMWIFHGSAD